MNLRSLRPLAAAVVLTLGAIVVIPLASDRPASAENRAEPGVARVVTSAVQEAPRLHTHTFYGVTAPAERTQVAFAMSGRMLTRTVDVGDPVTAGQVLAQLDDLPLRHQEQAARAQLDQLDAELAQLEREASRAERLLAANAGTRQGAEQIEARRDALLAARAGATASRREARRQRDETALIAPHDGVVVATLAEAGEVVAAGAPVLVVADPQALEVAFEVPESVRAAISLGQAANVILPFSASAPLPARVTQLGAVTPGIGRLFPVVVAVQGVSDRAGAAAEVEIAVPRPAGVSVPIASIVDPTGEAPGVWLVRENHALWTPVALLGASNGRLRVVGELEVDDRVIVLGHGALHDGERVEVAE